MYVCGLQPGRGSTPEVKRLSVGLVAHMSARIGPRFATGSTVIRRDIHADKVWTASPHRVLADTGPELVLAYWPGIISWAPVPWIAWTKDRDVAARARTLPSLAVGIWDLGLWAWRDTDWLSIMCEDEYFSVNLFCDPQRGPKFWYLNFQRPYTRTKIGVDTFDLFLDLVIDPDLSSYQWKDEAEYLQGRRLGIVDDQTHHEVTAARERAVAMVEGSLQSIAERWAHWRADPFWSDPTLTADAVLPVGGL